MPAKKIRSQNKTFIFLYLLFVVVFFCWAYCNAAYNAGLTPDGLNNTDDNSFIYKSISDFCFVAWIVMMPVLLVFGLNNVMTKGFKALKTPALVALATTVLYFIGLFCFKMFFKG